MDHDKKPSKNTPSFRNDVEIEAAWDLLGETACLCKKYRPIFMNF